MTVPVRLLMLVEGQSEEVFVKQTLAPFLETRGVHVRPVLLWTKRFPGGGGHRGGILSWAQLLKNLRPLTKDTDAWVTTLLDFYGLPEDFPGYLDALQVGDPRVRVNQLQGRFENEIGHPRFIPFLALHEFEAWLFGAPETVAGHFNQPQIATEMRRAAQAVGGAELIDQGEATHPKARLRSIVATYKEVADGATLMGKIGIDNIRRTCPHFAAWLGRLEALAHNG